MSSTIGKTPHGTGARLKEYARLVRLDKPIGIFLLLWPTLWALWLAADGRPDAWVFTVFVLGVVLMRSAGCAINDFADRDLDPHVARTRDRPLAAGRILPIEAVVVFAVLAATAFALVLTLNRLTILLSFGGLLLAAIYPFLKRYTSLPQFWLGAAFGWGIPMAYAAQTGSAPPAAWILFVANILWAGAYDTMYAMVDRDDDRKIGVRSTAILFGRYDRFIIAFLQIDVLVLLWLVGRMEGLGVYYQIGLAAAAGFAIYQHWLINGRDTVRCFRAFMNNAWFGAAVFFGIWLDYTLV